MISLADAEKKAIDFILEEWELSQPEKEWFVIHNSKTISDKWWHIIEVSVKDLPDKWVVQVYEDGECDPCYTFTSPFSEAGTTTQLETLPQKLATALQEERKGYI